MRYKKDGHTHLELGMGIHDVYRFHNDYGASVVRNSMSHGFELAVIKFTGPGDDDWDINYDTPITDDVIGFVADELPEILAQIEALERSE